MEKQRNNLIWLGTIVNTHGIKGEVRILSDSDEPEKRFVPGNKLIYFKNNTELTLTIKSYRFHKNFILATFEGYNNINDIEFIKGNKVYIPKGDKKLLIDYIGYEVVDANKGIIGTISDIKSESPYDNLYVNHNGKIINIPMIDKFVLKTDDLNKLIKVNIPEEFLN